MTETSSVGRIRVCFVCLGNICRSPTAEGVMRARLVRDGLSERFEIDSAGTAAYHAGELPDPRARAAAQRRGVELTHRARQVERGDVLSFDYLLAMDADNLAGLERVADGVPVASRRATITLFRSFDPEAPPNAEVPDPYYGGADGFDQVLDMCERACAGLIAAALRRAG